MADVEYGFARRELNLLLADASERLWLNLQSRYELEIERDRLARALDQIEPLAAG